MGANGHVIEKILNDGIPKVEKPAPEVGPEKSVEPQHEDATRGRASSATIPSTPPVAEHVIFSPGAPSSDSELSSLPSSPPQLPSPSPKSRKPTFSFLKRKRDAADSAQSSRPLSNITANAQKAPRPTQKTMTQMQIDLGGDVRKKCRTCGMEYIPSVKEDARLHKEYCGMNSGGIDMGKALLKDKSVKKIRSKEVLDDEKEAVVVVDEKSSLGARHKAQKVFDVVNAELSAAVLVDGALWSGTDGESGGKQKNTERSKVFLHLVGDRCVGFCLAEKISQAYRVVSQETGRQQDNSISPTRKSSSVSHSTTAEVVLLGISRIWASKAHRGHGLATNLLECARSNFFYGVEVPRHLVAFSQPTESGGKLAQQWFGSESGWHVYSGSQK